MDVIPLIDINQSSLPIGNIYETPLIFEKKNDKTSVYSFTITIFPAGYTITKDYAVITLTLTEADGDVGVYINYIPTSISKSTKSSATKDFSTSSLSSSTSPPSTSTSESEASSKEAVTTFDSVLDGSTVQVSTTVSSSTLETDSTGNSNNKDKYSGGLTGSNKIVVGVVVGVGGCILIGLISVLFYFKRRRNNRVYGNGWAFWRNHQKLDSDEFINGELGVRDRDFKNMSNF